MSEKTSKMEKQSSRMIYITGRDDNTYPISPPLEKNNRIMLQSATFYLNIYNQVGDFITDTSSVAFNGNYNVLEIIEILNNLANLTFTYNFPQNKIVVSASDDITLYANEFTKQLGLFEDLNILSEEELFFPEIVQLQQITRINVFSNFQSESLQIASIAIREPPMSIIQYNADIPTWYHTNSLDSINIALRKQDNSELNIKYELAFIAEKNYIGYV